MGMDWDLGLVGLMTLGSVAIGVGLVAQLLAGASAPNWLWLSVATVYLVVGVVIGEAWFGWASLDQLSLEQLLLIGLAPIPAVVLITRSLTSRGVSDGSSGRGPTRRSRHPRPRAL
jgi:hypothetical protein